MIELAHRHIVSAPDLPAARAPISQAVVAGSHCYISGQLATDVDGVFQSGTPREEAVLAFRNVFAALTAAGFAPADIVFVDVALTDMADLPEINTVFAELFPEGRRPARTVAQVVALPYGGKIKVQCMAVTREAF
jgi:2-iminobutanoate/2-iminopropanoate deaminase